MSLTFLNIRGLQSHIDDLRSFAMGSGVHIMAINETKLSKTTPDCLVSINYFALERKDRSVYGGGVALYVGNTISYKVIDTLPQHSLELLCIEVIPKHAKPFFVVCWYTSRFYGRQISRSRECDQLPGNISEGNNISR